MAMLVQNYVYTFCLAAANQFRSTPPWSAAILAVLAEKPFPTANCTTVHAAAATMAALWSLDTLNPLRFHFSLPFPDTLSHTLSELTKFESNVRSRKTAGLRQSTEFCRQGGGLDKYLGQKTC